MSIAVTVSVVVSAYVARCPRGGFLFDLIGARSVNVQPIASRGSHTGRGIVTKCDCRFCRGTWYSVVSYA